MTRIRVKLFFTLFVLILTLSVTPAPVKAINWCQVCINLCNMSIERCGDRCVNPVSGNSDPVCDSRCADQAELCALSCMCMEV